MTKSVMCRCGLATMVGTAALALSSLAHCGGSSTLAAASDGGSTPLDDGAASDSATSDGAASAARTLTTCTTNVADGAPAFYKKYFRCVAITLATDGVTIASESLPPHLSYYYGASSPNYAPFDTSRGTQYKPNPNVIKATSVSITIPNAPQSRGLTVDAKLVDGVVGTSTYEYGLGPQGVALDSVPLFNALAAPGDDIENEKYTFDSYEGHPTPTGAYHYHAASPGPLEVLVAGGLSSGTTPGSAGVEVYGIMCDGTLVLGCTELDGTARATSGLDAQGGHAHDLVDRDAVTHFQSRYHVHVCATDGGRKFTPEIQYYTGCHG